MRAEFVCVASRGGRTFDMFLMTIFDSSQRRAYFLFSSVERLTGSKQPRSMQALPVTTRLPQAVHVVTVLLLVLLVADASFVVTGVDVKVVVVAVEMEDVEDEEDGEGEQGKEGEGEGVRGIGIAGVGGGWARVAKRQVWRERID